MDDQQQRKRPRLESVEAGATEASLALKQISNNGKDSHRSPSPPKLPTTMATSPTSKVTINTRSIQSPAQPCSQDTQISDQQSFANDVDVTMIPEPSPGHGQDDAISISSSSSPEIQVAEVEDYDEDGSETTWRSLTGTVMTRFGSDYVYMTFPYAKEQFNGPGRVGTMITRLSKILTDDNCSEVMMKLHMWLSELLDHEEQITPDFLKSELVFWNDLPDLIGAILRRE
jgi:hypothetical protein